MHVIVYNMLWRQDRTLVVDEESQEAVVRRSFNHFDEEGLTLYHVLMPELVFTKVLYYYYYCTTSLIAC